MKKEEINIRDPFVLYENGTYYLYGTRAENWYGKQDGFDCYYSTDMENWSEPVEIFKKPEGFWADMNYWAPECHKYKGNYYLFASFKSQDACRGTQILKADNPLGPFVVHSQTPVTPADWECLDGTLYISQDSKPYLVFCHEWAQIKDGTICAVQLSDDLTCAVGKPFVLFKASDAPWACQLKLSEDMIKMMGDDKCFVTDGPYMYRCENGELLLLWSSFSKSGYVEAVARSKSGRLEGPWTHDDELLFPDDGGHGMLFLSPEKSLYLVLHAPNETPYERPVFYEVKEIDNKLIIGAK